MQATLFVPVDWQKDKRYKLLWRHGFESELGQLIALTLVTNSPLYRKMLVTLSADIIWVSGRSDTINLRPRLDIDLRTPIGPDPALADDRNVVNCLKVALSQTELGGIIPNLVVSIDTNYRCSVALNE